VKRVLISTVALCAVVSAWAEEAHPVSARLVADASNGLRVGVQLTMEPGWHVYWVNPGDSGLATEVMWSAPEGVALGPLQWPAPEVFTSPGDLTSFGYSGEVTLAADVGTLSGPPRGTLRAAVSWLACKDVCLLGDATLEADLGDVAGFESAEAFRTADAHSVRPLADAPFGLRRDQGDSGPRVWLTWAEQPDLVEVFPSTRSGRHPIAKARTRGGLTRIDLDLRGGSLPVELIVVAVDDGTRNGYRVPVGAP
jgi:DsbC/DsbD-like thiol-disulfide interchange protein